MSDPIPTTERLAAALEAADAPTGMILAARRGRYDDYKSELTFPEMQLVADLRDAAKRTPAGARRQGLEDLAQRVIDGDFDATKAESDAWAASPEGQAAFRDLIAGSGESEP